MSPRRGRPPAVRLDPARIDAWRVERQLLARRRAASPEEVARELVGVQAQVTSSAALSIALRSGRVGRRPPIDATTRALRGRRLVRSWAMRSTLHLFAPEDVPTVAAALGGQERWRRTAWLRWFGTTEREMESMIDAIGEILDDGRPRTRAELAEEVTGRFGPAIGRLLLGSWGAALKVASDRHYLVQSSGDDAGVRFVRASRWITPWRVEDRTAALASLVVRYLAAYGPATMAEILRWWGMSVVAVMQPILEELGDVLTPVEVDGVRAWARTQDIGAIEATRPTRGAVQLVGGFDPLIVGGGLRARLIPATHLKRVSRTAGWISPVVLVDGVAAGIWDSQRSGGSLRITVELFAPLSAVATRALVPAAGRVAAAQGLVPELAHGRVFATKGAPLRIGPEDA